MSLHVYRPNTYNGLMSRCFFVYVVLCVCEHVIYIQNMT